MMSIKRGTQAWSKAETQAPIRTGATGDGPLDAQNAAGDFQKSFGDQAVGDVLNKIADPNWVDPTRKVRTTGNNELDKDAFFKLMLTQMKNQDPTNPLQSHEMAAQLAQFSSLEQLNNINTAIDGMAKAQSGQSNFGALSFIGKKVSGDASKVSRAAGDTEHGFNFAIGGDAAKTKVSVKDSTGKVVRVIEPGALKKGANSIRWNGLTDEGLPARPGEYRFTVEAVNSSGGKVFAKSEFEGRITGVDFTAQGPNVIVNGQSIKLSDVKKIEESEEPNQARASALSVGQSSKEQKFIPPAEDVPMGNLDSVPMASGLMAKIDKETK